MVPYPNAEETALEAVKCRFESYRDYHLLTPLSVTAAQQAYILYSTRLVRGVGSNPAAAIDLWWADPWQVGMNPPPCIGDNGVTTRWPTCNTSTGLITKLAVWLWTTF